MISEVRSPNAKPLTEEGFVAASRPPSAGALAGPPELSKPRGKGASRPSSVSGKRVCEFCGETYRNRGFHMENVCTGALSPGAGEGRLNPEDALARQAGGTDATSASGESASPDPKPEKRVTDGCAEPIDGTPIDGNFCPLCKEFVLLWERAHIVGKGVGGDDLPENLAWLCRWCHADLHVGYLGGLTQRRLVIYCRETVPELGEYADSKKFIGWLELRYLGPDRDLEEPRL